MARKARRPEKTHDEIFGEIMTGFGEAIAYARGELEPGTYRVHLPEEIDVKAVREKTGLSQDKFAGAYGFKAGTVRDWEQKRYTPDQAARAYLYVIGEKPDMVRETLAPLRAKRDATDTRTKQAAIDAARAPKKHQDKIVSTPVAAKPHSARASRSH